jgi:thiol-disulfide isomerase/thioredoxin
MRLTTALAACALALTAFTLGHAQSGLPAFRGVVEPFQVHSAPREMPALSFTDGEGRALTLADFRGRVVLLNLWATWCPPCVEEMPALDRLQAALGGDSFEVLALSIDRTGRRVVDPFMQRHGLTRLRVYLDTPNASTRLLQVRGLPTTLLLDREGREIGRMAGAAAWDSAASLALMRAAMARSGQAPASPAAPAQPPRPTLELEEFPEDRRPAPNDGTRADAMRPGLSR